MREELQVKLSSKISCDLILHGDEKNYSFSDYQESKARTQGRHMLRDLEVSTQHFKTKKASCLDYLAKTLQMNCYVIF